MNAPDFYMTSGDVYPDDDFARVRACWRLQRVVVGLSDRNISFLVRVEPALPGRLYGVDADAVSIVMLQPRLVGYSLFPIETWPTPVYVSACLVSDPTARQHFDGGEVKMIGWGDLWPSESEALKHRHPPRQSIRIVR